MKERRAEKSSISPSLPGGSFCQSRARPGLGQLPSDVPSLRSPKDENPEGDAPGLSVLSSRSVQGDQAISLSFLLSFRREQGIGWDPLPPFRGILLWPTPRQGCGHFQREKEFPASLSSTTLMGWAGLDPGEQPPQHSWAGLDPGEQPHRSMVQKLLPSKRTGK